MAQQAGRQQTAKARSRPSFCPFIFYLDHKPADQYHPPIIHTLYPSTTPVTHIQTPKSRQFLNPHLRLHEVLRARDMSYNSIHSLKCISF